MQTKIRYLVAILLLGLIAPGVVAAAEPEAAASWQDKRGAERFAPLDWLRGVTENGARIVVETTEVENGPPAMRTRYTITRQDADHYQGAFEVAMPGKDFVCLQNLSMRRVK